MGRVSSVVEERVEETVGHVAIIGGTHGNELTGAWLVERWRRDPSPVQRESFSTHLLLGNPKAIQRVRRYIDRDLNRSFGDTPPTSDARDSQRPVPYEQERAHVVCEQLRTFRVIPDGALIDLHNTTANMGISLIFVNQSPFNLKLAAWVKERVPEAHAYLWLDETLPRRSLSSVVEKGVTIEVGPVPNGVVRGEQFWRTEETVRAALDFVEAFNQGLLSSDKRELEVFVHEQAVDFPRDERGRVTGFIHPELQDRDYEPLEPGDPVFQTLAGETIRYDGPETRYPVFINEAAYYEKHLAFSLTRREVREV